MLKTKMAKLLSAGVVTLVVAAASVLTAGPASAAVTHHVYRTCSTPGGCGLWLRSGATTGASHLGLMSDGQAFNVNCWALGPTVINDPVWLQGTWNGIAGWGEDYYIDTHWAKTADLTAQGIPQCGTATPPPSNPTPTPTGGQTAAEKGAVNWSVGLANAHSSQYYLLCLTFTFNAYSNAGVNLRPWVNVPITNNSYPQDIWGHFTHGRTGKGTPPYGALVFFNATPGHDRTYSHVAISTGGGNLVSSGDSINRQMHTETLTQRANAHLYNSYIGWWLPDA